MQGCNDGHCMKSHRLEPLNRSMLHYVVFFLQNVFSVAFYNEKWMVLPEGLELKHRKSMCAGLCLQILSCISWKTRAKYFAVENEKINRISSVIFFFHYSMISPVCIYSMSSSGGVWTFCTRTINTPEKRLKNIDIGVRFRNLIILTTLFHRGMSCIKRKKKKRIEFWEKTGGWKKT